MTDEEASKLRPGERVRVVKKKTAFTGRFIEAKRSRVGGVGMVVHLLRDGLTEFGNKRLPTVARAEFVHLLDTHDAATANVFADWLAERGQYEAADMLRQAFPYSAIPEGVR